MEAAALRLLSNVMCGLLSFQKNTEDLHLLNLNWLRWVLDASLQFAGRGACVFLDQGALLKASIIFYRLLMTALIFAPLSPFCLLLSQSDMCIGCVRIRI